MRNRDESIALRSLTAAVEAHTDSIRNLTSHIETRFNILELHLDTIDGHINTLIDTVADHIAHHNGES